MSETRPPIAITPGEPAGIGPDLVIQFAQQAYPEPLVAIADPDLLRTRARQLGLPLTLHPVPNGPVAPLPAGKLYLEPVKLVVETQAGRLDPANSPYVLACLANAVEGCQTGKYRAMVTGPVHKGVINDAGIAFTGHTEYLAEKNHTDQVVMMLATQTLRVALATTHLPLKDVPQAITREGLSRTLAILHTSLNHDFGIPSPRILVCGLNPHAGEDGHLGREEIEVIEPTLEQLRECGMNLIGPLPADSLFTPANLENADAVLAMYHDQGLPVLKYCGFGQAVNVTLGLPIVRTSVDHGTALELAGTGKADTGSLGVALEIAVQMTTRGARN